MRQKFRAREICEHDRSRDCLRIGYSSVQEWMSTVAVSELERVVVSLDNLAEQIRKRAYEIWECEGRPHGRDIQHWSQAETEFHPRLRVVVNDSSSEAPRTPARKKAQKPARK